MAAAPPNMEELGNLIRYWAHYDTMLQALTKQSQSVRKQRDTYEDQIIQKLRAGNIENAVIQIAGGRLLVSEERHSTPLSFRSLQTMLHDYYRTKPGAIDETNRILDFIKSQRQVNTSKRLKRHAGPALLNQTGGGAGPAGPPGQGTNLLPPS